MAHSKCHQDTGRDLTPCVSSALFFNNIPLERKEKTEGTLAESHAKRTKPRITGLPRAGLSVGERGEDRRKGQQTLNREGARTVPGKAQDKRGPMLELKYRQPRKENKAFVKRPFNDSGQSHLLENARNFNMRR